MVKYSELTEEQKEKRRASHRKWAARADRKDYYREYDKNRSTESKIERNEKLKEYRRANPEKYRQWARESYQRNKDNDRFCNSAEWKLHKYAKVRAKNKNSLFDLEVSDIVIPEQCPCCKEEMLRPSIDQIKPGEGYTKTNIAVICYDCNVIKSYGTAERHRQIADWMDSMID